MSEMAFANSCEMERRVGWVLVGQSCRLMCTSLVLYAVLFWRSIYFSDLFSPTPFGFSSSSYSARMIGSFQGESLPLSY